VKGDKFPAEGSNTWAGEDGNDRRKERLTQVAYFLWAATGRQQ